MFYVFIIPDTPRIIFLICIFDNLFRFGSCFVVYATLPHRLRANERLLYGPVSTVDCLVSERERAEYSFLNYVITGV